VEAAYIKLEHAATSFYLTLRGLWSTRHRVNLTRGQLVTWLVLCGSQLVTPMVVT